MWSVRIILVGNKLFSFKGKTIHEKLGIPKKAFSCIGSFVDRYLPSTDCEESVEIHHLIFESGEVCEIWMSSLERHPEGPAYYHDSPIYRAIGHLSCKKLPLRKAAFELKLIAEGIKPFWWVKDNIQNKEWEETINGK